MNFDHIGKKDFWHDLRGMELRQLITLPQKMSALKKRKTEKNSGILFQSYERGRDNTKGTGKNVHKIILDTKNLNDLPDIEGAGKRNHQRSKSTD